MEAFQNMSTEWAGRCGCEMPERPLSFGAYICSKPGCRISVEATVRKYPNLKLCIKFGGPRQVITAAEFLAATDPAFTEEERIRNLLGYSINPIEPEGDWPGEYIREIFVLDGTGAPS